MERNLQALHKRALAALVQPPVLEPVLGLLVVPQVTVQVLALEPVLVLRMVPHVIKAPDTKTLRFHLLRPRNPRFYSSPLSYFNRQWQQRSQLR